VFSRKESGAEICDNADFADEQFLESFDDTRATMDGLLAYRPL